ncbi:MAG: arginine--tRNA ligase [Bacilli bacterium]|nr:arginine--tRNA ligase [Bacilli bacterium]MBQ6404666.1 arginine--tRNA ligase [Bacilli bacterium]
MSVIKKLEADIKGILKKAGYEVDKVLLEPSNRRDLGEYQINNAMQLTKIYHENPRDIAAKIVTELEKDNRFTNINIAGPGFINISFSDQYIYDFLNEIHEDVHNNIDKKEPKKIIVDYGGANVAKALHVGHLRTGNIGEALKRLALLLGYDALGDAHLGDYGRPLGLVLREIKERYPELKYFDENYTGDYSEVELPITNKDLEEIYPVASNKAKEDEQYLEEARIITAKIQSHEKGYYDLWKRVVDISKEDIKKTYESLNVSFEIWNGESDEMEYFDELLKIYEDKNLLVDSEGARVVEVATPEDKAPMPPLLFIRSNGAASYETTDLAAILERKINYNPDEIWYVVDARQALHFEQTFRAARKAKLVEDRVVLEHVGNGTMNGKDGKPFKTRDGGVMSLKALMDLVYDETYKKITNESIKEEEKKEIARIVAMAAVKYADLLPYRGTDYIFELEKFTDLEGKTGPYLLYSTIRMRSLLKKAEEFKATKITKLKGSAEKEIALTLLTLPLVLNRAVEAKTLNEIAEFLYKLTACYNSFYAENKIIIEEDADLRNSWIVLTETVYNINMLLLGILGIEVPEKM